MNPKKQDSIRRQIRASWSPEEKAKRKAFSAARQLQLEYLLFHAGLVNTLNAETAELQEEMAIAS